MKKANLREAWVELSAPNIEYLISAISHQIENRPQGESGEEDAVEGDAEGAEVADE